MHTFSRTPFKTLATLAFLIVGISGLQSLQSLQSLSYGQQIQELVSVP